MTCHTVVVPSSVRSHLQRQHPDSAVPFDKHVLEAIVRKEDLYTHWPSIPSSKGLEFAGLDRVWGYKCPNCPAMYVNSKTALAHMIDIHRIRLTADDLERDWMQRLSSHHEAKTWFPVIPSSAQLSSPSADYLKALRQELDKRPILLASDVDHRHISPWHSTTRWLEYLEGRDPRAMQALIQIPKDGAPLFFLVAGVRHYMEAAYDLIQQSSEVCLQILNTDIQTE